MPDPGALVERLEWDSDFFGFGVGRVRPAVLTASDAAQCARQARQLGLRCVYFLADPGDPDTWRASLAAGFEPIDIRVELDREDLPTDPAFRDCVLAGPEDLPSMTQLARGAFEGSRFFRDRRFPAGKAEQLFEIWSQRDVAGPDGFAVLCRPEGAAAGFASARLTSVDTGRIELVAVGAGHRGRGVGLRVLGACLRELGLRSVRRVCVVTQGSNAAALRLYERAGFRTRSLGVWFHGWF